MVSLVGDPHARVVGIAHRSQPAICSGDQRHPSLASTTARNLGVRTNLHGLGRAARRSAAMSARWAQSRWRPPLRASSRDTVDDARPRRTAITRQASPAATPRLISSRSAADNEWAGRRRGGCLTPPLCNPTGPHRGPALAHPASDQPQRRPLPPPRPELLLFLDRQSPGPHPSPPTADAPVSAEAMQPPIATATGFGQPVTRQDLAAAHLTASR
jgi:hypothetical protein